MNKNSILSIKLLGGVDEIGSNMTVLETSKEYFILDYGILFPNDDIFEINYLIVDYSDLDPKKKTTLFITHGHEDHIGAVTHILNYFFNFKIYAPEFAANLIRKKLLQRKMLSPIKVYTDKDVLNFDGFKVHPIHVTHSIPQTHGIVLNGKGLSVLFISDFKYDLNPLYEKAFDIEKIKELFNKEEMRICLLDSTNILNQGKTDSERDLLNDIDHLLSLKKRTFVTLFSSNIHRLRSFFEIAKKYNKKTSAVGRSIYNYLEAAQQSKIFNYQDFNFFEDKAITNPNSDDLVVFLTGSQGDFMGALKRLANNDHKVFKFKEGDQVLFSSKPIPGNEKKISQIYNAITSLGADIVTAKDFKIHASGHPGQEDLKELLSHLNPTHYIPIHGETYFLKKHAEFVKKELGLNSYFLGNFDTINISKDLDFEITSSDKKDPLLIHGNFLEIDRSKIAQRRKIASQGIVFVTLDTKKKSFNLSYQGLPDSIEEHMETINNLIKGCAFNEFKNAPSEKRNEGVRVRVRQVFKQFLGYRPIVVVHDV